MKFDDLLARIKDSEPFVIIIEGVSRKAVFCASYYTEHYPDEEYYKVFFDDGTMLEIMPSAESLFFCDDIRRKIDRSSITDFGEYLNIDGKKYLLTNHNDEQYVKKVYFGDNNGEGECVFSEYGFANEVWSLAVLGDGSVSDIHMRKISIMDIGLK